MSFPNSVETTRPMTTEEMSGHMNDDYSYPSVVQKVSDAGKTNRGLSDPSTARGVTAPIVIQDISADKHGTDVSTPDHVGGFPFRVRES